MANGRPEGDGIKAGMAEYKPLTPKEEKECYRLWKSTGDAKYRNQIIQGVYPLVVRMVQPYRDTGIDPDELVNEAILAAINAFEKWNPEKSRFSTYMSRPIQWRISHYLKKSCPIFSRKAGGGRFVRPDPRKREASRFSTTMGSSQDDILSLLCSTDPVPDEAMEDSDMLDYARDAFHALDPQDQNIVARRLDDEGYRSISSDLGVSQEGARQIYIRAAEKMREHIQKRLAENSI